LTGNSYSSATAKGRLTVKLNRALPALAPANLCEALGPGGVHKKGNTANGGHVKHVQKEDTGMDFINRLYVKATEWRKGQTMTEYALILSAVAVVVFIGYKTMGTDISSLLGTIDSQL
jgi:Flp pilus assembly pilin Flp